jgi:bacillithiol system protein YtxJ
VVFKHSPACGASFRALEQIAVFAKEYPDVPVVVVDVIGQRELSESIAGRFGVRHESPQAIVVHGGRAVWSASHGRISAHAVAEPVARAAMEL